MKFVNIKKSLLSLISRTPTPEKITNFEELAAAILGKYSLDEEQTKQKRQEITNELQRLEELMNQESPKELKNLANATEKQLSEYLEALKRQLFDSQEIIGLIKKLIHMEDFEIIQDLKIPLSTFEEFIKFVSNSLKDTRIDNDHAIKIKNSLDELQEIYQQLSATIIRYVQHELSIYQGGTNFTNVGVTQVSLQQHLTQRATNKRELDAAVTGIIGQIGTLHKDITHAKEDKEGVDEKIVESLVLFQESFRQLTNYCEQRVKASDAIIQEGIRVQTQKIAEMQALRQKIKAVEQKLLELAKKNEQSEEVAVKQEAKKLEEETKAAIRKADQEIVKVEKGDLKALKRERRWTSGLIGRLQKTAVKITKIAAVLALVGALSSGYYDDKQRFDFWSNVRGEVMAFRSVDEGFAKHYGENDYRFKLVRAAVERINNPKYVGYQNEVRVSRPDLVEDYEVIDCISFINDVNKEAQTGLRGQDRIDKVIAQAKSKGWEVYFVCRDPTNRSEVMGADGQFIHDTVVARGNYPFVGSIGNVVMGEQAVQDFQNKLKGRIGFVSFNLGYHSAMVLDGKLVHAHTFKVGGGTIEGKDDFVDKMAHPGSGAKGWEIAVVALAPQ